MTKSPTVFSLHVLCWIGVFLSSLGSAAASSQWHQEDCSSLLRPPPATEPEDLPAASPQPVQNEKIPVPALKPKHIDLSLRMTCELNRRLRRGSLAKEPQVLNRPAESHHIASGSAWSEPLTIFHARSTSSEDGSSGVERWSPSLHEFTRQLIEDTLELSEEESFVVLSLAMIYLDRASSVETPRSNGIPPCPFCSTRTVHRLLLTSILTAVRVVSGQAVELDEVQLEAVGQCAQDVFEMMTWMEAAMGDVGYYVGIDEMQKFKAMWEKVVDGQPDYPPKEDEHKNQKQQTDTLTDDSNDVDHHALLEVSPSADEEAQASQSAVRENKVKGHSTAGSVHASHAGFRPLPAFTSTRVHA